GGASGSWESVEYGVTDFGCSYQMCLKKEYFETLELVDGGVVHLGDEKRKVQGMVSVCLTRFAIVGFFYTM
ncbi:hypothetical protein A2U01_0105411, partial [Trifolium medium]|nr:hypothetical protein [Trifolium medium]